MPLFGGIQASLWRNLSNTSAEFGQLQRGRLFTLEGVLKSVREFGRFGQSFGHELLHDSGVYRRGLSRDTWVISTFTRGRARLLATRSGVVLRGCSVTRDEEQSQSPTHLRSGCVSDLKQPVTSLRLSLTKPPPDRHSAKIAQRTIFPFSEAGRASTRSGFKTVTVRSARFPPSNALIVCFLLLFSTLAELGVGTVGNEQGPARPSNPRRGDSLCGEEQKGHRSQII